MMKATNGYSTLFLLIALVLTGEAVHFSSFASRHPYIIYNILIIGVTQAIGQLFLFVMVSEIITYIQYTYREEHICLFHMDIVGFYLYFNTSRFL